MQRSKGWIVTSLAIVALSAGCATAGTTTGDPAPSEGVGQNPVNPAEQWAIKTRAHLDLWLHGFAMITDDTTLVPYFRRGYATQMAGLKSRSNIVTQLDANNARLKSRVSINPGLVNAQFLALYFDSFDDMASAVDVFYRADGNPRAASNQETMETIALLAGYFPNAADRDWARLLVQSLRDEDTRFYRSYWNQQQRELGAVFTAVNSLWQNTYRARFQNFLTNTSQTAGEIYLSLPLNGEGRTLSAGKRQNATAITFPQRASDANEAIYVLAHEVVGSLVGTAVNDNVTPTDRRLGVADRYIANGAVRAGAMLLQKIAPELVNGYTRYYLQSANRNAGTLSTVFTLPDPIRDAIQRQVDVVLGGI